MPGKRDPKALPKGKTRDSDHLDARHGDYSEARLLEMDAAFHAAMERALHQRVDADRGHKVADNVSHFQHGERPGPKSPE